MSEYTHYQEHLNDVGINWKSRGRLYRVYYKKNVFCHIRNTDARILDVGCGQGDLLKAARQVGFSNVQGIDMVSANVAACKRDGLHVVEADLFSFFPNSETYDVIIANNVIEHLEKDQIVVALNYFLSHLNSGGRIVLIFPNCNNIDGVTTFFSDITHKTALNEKSFADLLRQTSAARYSFEPLVVYPGIPLLDSLVVVYSRFVHLLAIIRNLFHGQVPFSVHSKNILVLIDAND